MVNVPLKKKKKKVQVSSPGRAGLAWASHPYTQIIKNEGGERYGIQKLPPPLIQKKEHEGLRFLLPQATFGCLLLSFLVL